MSSNTDIWNECKAQIETIRQIATQNMATIAALEAKVDMIVASNQSINQLLKYVVTPLIVIVGALVGVRIALPNV